MVLVESKLTPGLCDVVGCQEASTQGYLDCRGSRSLSFRVCIRHFEQLGAGTEPVIVDHQFDNARTTHGGPALLLE